MLGVSLFPSPSFPVLSSTLAQALGENSRKAVCDISSSATLTEEQVILVPAWGRGSRRVGGLSTVLDNPLFSSPSFPVLSSTLALALRKNSCKAVCDISSALLQKNRQYWYLP